MKYLFILLLFISCNDQGASKIAKDTWRWSSKQNFNLSQIKQSHWITNLDNWVRANEEYIRYRDLELQANLHYAATGDEKYSRQFYLYQEQRIKYAKLAHRYIDKLNQ